MQYGKLRDKHCWGLERSFPLLLVLRKEKDVRDLLREDLLDDSAVKWTTRWRDFGLTPLHIAAHDDSDITGLLIQHTHCEYDDTTRRCSGVFCVHAIDRAGETPLHIAASKQRLALIPFLARIDNVDMKSKDGLTASDKAFECGYEDIVQEIAKIRTYTVAEESSNLAIRFKPENYRP